MLTFRLSVSIHFPFRTLRCICAATTFFALTPGQLFATVGVWTPNPETEVWESANGLVITGSSGARPGSDLRDMFGGTSSSTERGTALFRDDRAEGFVHFVEWKTPAPVRVESFRLHAVGDSPLYNNEREFDQFTLTAKSRPDGDFDLVLYRFRPPHPYVFADSAAFLLLEANVQPTEAQFFRAEFVQFNGRRGFDGPRINELDGFETPLVDPARDYAWVQRGGGIGNDHGNSVALDGNDVYVGGDFDRNATFGGRTLTTPGASAVFLAKYDHAGNLLWTQQTSGNGNSFARGVALDRNSNACLAGSFDNTTTFFSSPGTTTLGAVFPQSGANWDIFIASYDRSGALRFAERAGGNGRDAANAIALDNSGNICVAGSLEGSSQFGGTSLTSQSSGRDALLLKFDSAGKILWAKRAGGAGFDEALGVATDLSGNIYVTGRFEGSAQFGTRSITSNGEADIFVAKFDSAGNVLWARSAGGANKDTGNAIAVDGYGIYVTGMFFERAAFGNSTLTASGLTADIFVSKYDNAGNLLWAKPAGGRGTDYGSGIATDQYGSVYATGQFEDGASFGGGTLVSGGLSDIFAVKYDAFGNVIWAKSAGGNNADAGAGIAVEKADFAYVTGAIADIATFRNSHVKSAGAEDMFVAKLVLALPPTPLPPSQLLIRTVEEGARLTSVFATASGSAPRTFQWLIDGRPIPGATGQVLSLPSIALTNAGNYLVIVSNSAASVTNWAAQISVLHTLTNSVAVTTLVGSGVAGYADGQGRAARFNSPNDASVATDGTIYVADTFNQRIRRITPDGTVSTVAGSGVAGFSDGPSVTAQFNVPLGIFQDRAGDLLVADAENHRIRKVSLAGSGTVSTVAGTGQPGYLSGTVSSARFNFPNDLVMDSAGNIFVSEFNNHGVRKITPGGEVLFFAGTGVAGFSDGAATAQFNQPAGLAIDKYGYFYVSEWGNQRIRRLTPQGAVEAGVGTGVAGFVDGLAAGARFNQPDDLVADREGNIFVVEHGNHAVRRIGPGGATSTVAGTGQAGYVDGQGREARFALPSGLALDGSGNLIVSDTGNHVIRKITFKKLAKIVTQPQSQTTQPGGTIKLTISATGDEPLRYQWRHDGIELVGATTATLTLANVRSTDAGNYTVLVSNPAGTIPSDLATVTLSTPAEVVLRQLPPGYAPGIKFSVVLQARPPANTIVYAVEDSPPAGWTVGSISENGLYDAVNRKVKFGPFFDATVRSLSYDLTPPSGETDRKEFKGIASMDGVSSPVGGPNTIELTPPFHPADNNPADSRISINEVTAYGVAWRRGSTWPNPPNPIPIDYLTRAGTLWKGGEDYTVDPSVPNAPLWWVNRPAVGLRNIRAMSQISLTAGESTVAAIQPDRFVPGDPFTVQLSVKPASSVQAFAVQDEIPPGWTVTNISHNGEFDAVNRQVKWGPFFDNQPRELSYQTTPGRDAPNEANLVGLASFDGNTVPIAGSRRVRATVRLASWNRSSNGELTFTLRGKPGAELVIQVSSDLQIWNTVGTAINANGEVNFQVPAANSSVPRFFRAVTK